MGLQIDFPFSIFENGTLISDILTTLPFNTIGIDENRRLDRPKQIYDIAQLLKSVSHKIPIQDIIETFKKISKEEISYHDKNPSNICEILDDLIVFSKNLLKI